MMMAMMKYFKLFTLRKKSPEEDTEEDQLFFKTYGKEIDFTDQSTIKPLVDYICAL
jgi:hypothetical protein